MTVKTGKTIAARKPRGWRWRTRLLSACGFALVLAAGCSSSHQRQLMGDPIYGEYGIKQPGPSTPPAPPGLSSSQAPTGMPRGSVPAITPAPFAPTSAGLAAGGSLPGARPLSIHGAGGTAAAPASNATPVSRQPIVQPVPRDNGAGLVPVSNNAWTPQPVPNSTEALLAKLQTRGMRNYKIDQLPQGVRLSVIVPSTTQPGTTHFYEATGRDLAAAVNAILQKMGEAR